MPEPVVEIPNRPAFRASEVCELAQIPPYVLKSWEKEFPGLGVAPKPGAARVYRRADVEQVLRIKQMLFNEGLTLSGVRRKLEGEPKPEEEPLPELPPAAGEVREKVGRIKQGLRSLLDMLSAPVAAEGNAAPQRASAPAPATPSVQSGITPAEPAPAASAVAETAMTATEERAVAAEDPAGGDLFAADGGDTPKAARRAKRAARAPRQSA